MYVNYVSYVVFWFFLIVVPPVCVFLGDYCKVLFVSVLAILFVSIFKKDVVSFAIRLAVGLSLQERKRKSLF